MRYSKLANGQLFKFASGFHYDWWRPEEVYKKYDNNFAEIVSNRTRIQTKYPNLRTSEDIILRGFFVYGDEIIIPHKNKRRRYR